MKQPADFDALIDRAIAAREKRCWLVKDKKLLYLVDILIPLYRKQAKANQGNQDGVGKSKATAPRLAKTLGIGSSKVKDIICVLSDESIRAAVEDGSLSIHAASLKIKRLRKESNAKNCSEELE